MGSFKKSYSTEAIIMILSGFSGMLFYIGGIYSFVGFFNLFIVSYFFVSLLKKQTIIEFTERFKYLKD